MPRVGPPEDPIFVESVKRRRYLLPQACYDGGSPLKRPKDDSIRRLEVMEYGKTPGNTALEPDGLNDALSSPTKHRYKEQPKGRCALQFKLLSPPYRLQS